MLKLRVGENLKAGKKSISYKYILGYFHLFVCFFSIEIIDFN